MCEWTQKKEDSFQNAVASVRMETEVLTDEVVDLLRDCIKREYTVDQTLKVVLEKVG